MKTRMYFAAVLLTAMLSACTSSQPETPEKPEKEPAPPVEQKKETAATASTVSEAELQYVKALREPDKVKRFEMYKAARQALLEEAEKNHSAKAHLLLGYMADLGQGMRSDGIQAARHYRIAADSGMVEAKIALAEFWRRNEIFLNEAVKQITSIPNYEENPVALCTLGSVYYAMYENEKGFQVLKKAYRSPKATPNVRLDVLKVLHGMFEKYFKGNNYDAALKELERTAELAPGNHLTYYLMGLVEIRRGDLVRAEKMFKRSWKANPAFPEVYRELAMLKARAGRFDEAVDDAKTAYAISGRQPEFGHALVEIYFLSKRLDEMLRLIDLLLKGEPDNKGMRLIRVSVLQLKKEYGRAYEDLKVLMKDPKCAQDPVCQEMFANVSSMVGKYDDAIKANEAILKQGFRPVPALNLAELYIITGRYDKAVELLEHPDLKDAKDPLLLCVVPYLEACALLASGKNADQAIGHFRTALPEFLAAKKDPREWDTTMFRAWLKKAKLSEDVKKKITELTDALDAAPTVKKPDGKESKAKADPNAKLESARKKIVSPKEPAEKTAPKK